MYETVARANRGRPFEIEISLDRRRLTRHHGGTPVSWVSNSKRAASGMTGLALRRRQTTIRPRSKPSLGEHLAVASFCGPYKLSFCSGRTRVRPWFGDHRTDVAAICFITKRPPKATLEALRLAWRLEPDLFHRILAAAGAAPVENAADAEALYIDSHPGGRQTDRLSGEVLADGPLRAALLDLLDQRADVYQELLSAGTPG